MVVRFTTTCAISNKKFKIDNAIGFFYYKWCDAGIFFINDLLDENNEFLSFNRFKEIYGIETTFLQYMGRNRVPS
jgi:hypothetical protein